MKIIVLGCGNIGTVAAQDLAQGLPSAQIILADMDRKRAEEAAKKTGHENVSSMQIDASNKLELLSALKRFDVSIGALPGVLGFRACKASIAAEVDMVDVSYMSEDVMVLDKPALKAGVCIVPDCGMSPGLGSVLVGRAVSRLDGVESVHMLNGGLPEKPVPPLGYAVTWSVRDLIDMYNRKVTIVEAGRVKKVEPLTGLEQITVPKLGKLEAFYTDGLRTLLHTVRDVQEMWEKTLRYPGHVEKIKLLKGLGYLDEKPVSVQGCSVSPQELTSRLFEKHLRKPNILDIVVMLVRVTGEMDNRKTMFAYQLIDRYDRKRKVTAMARTTAYTASIVAQLLAKKAIEEKGVVPPEMLGMNEKLYGKLTDQMSRRGMRIQEEMKRV